MPGGMGDLCGEDQQQVEGLPQPQLPPQLLPQLLPPQQQSRRIRMMIQQQLPPKKPLLHIMNLLVR